MKKIIYIMIIIVFSEMLIACSIYPSIDAGVDNDVFIKTSDYSDTNSMLTTLPIFEDESGIYYAEQGKELKKMTDDNEKTLYLCEKDEIICDIYADDNFIYYVREVPFKNKCTIMRIDKQDFNKKQELFSVPCKGLNSSGDGFVYSDADTVYYYNSSDRILYYNSNGEVKSIGNITDAMINHNVIYYADAENLYVCDKDLSNSRKIWSIKSMPPNNDNNSFAHMYNSRIQSENSIIRDISIVDNRIYFVISEFFAENGVLVDIKPDGTDVNYVKNVWIYKYQINNGDIYGSAMYSNDSVEVFNLKTLEPINLKKTHIAVYDS